MCRKDRVEQTRVVEAPEQIGLRDQLFEEPFFQAQAAHQAMLLDGALAGEDGRVSERTFDGAA